MGTFLTVPLTGLVIDTDKHLALRTADLHRGAFGGQHRFPVIRPAHKIAVLRILDHIPDIKDSGMIIEGHVQTGDLQAVICNEREQSWPAEP